MLHYGQPRAQAVDPAHRQVGVGVAWMLLYPFQADVHGLVGKPGVFLLQLGVRLVLQVFKMRPLGHGDAEMGEWVVGIFLKGQVELLQRLFDVHGVDGVYPFFGKRAQVFRQRLVDRGLGRGGDRQQAGQGRLQKKVFFHCAILSAPM